MGLSLYITIFKNLNFFYLCVGIARNDAFLILYQAVCINIFGEI